MADLIEHRRRPVTAGHAASDPAAAKGAPAASAASSATQAAGHAPASPGAASGAADSFAGHARANKFAPTEGARGVPPPPQADHAQREQQGDALRAQDLQREERLKA